MDVKIYEGKFGNEQLLFDDVYDSLSIAPQKGDFVFYKTEVYKVMYAMVDIDNEEYSIFVRKAIEEDY